LPPAPERNRAAERHPGAGPDATRRPRRRPSSVAPGQQHADAQHDQRGLHDQGDRADPVAPVADVPGIPG
jgi:hypothetical protein